MASGVTVEEVLNGGDHAMVTTSGAPSGPLTFWYGRTPESSAAVLGAATGSGPYSLPLPHDGLWYIWAHDNKGFTAPPGAGWLGTPGGALHRDLNQIGNRRGEVLDKNRVGC